MSHGLFQSIITDSPTVFQGSDPPRTLGTKFKSKNKEPTRIREGSLSSSSVVLRQSRTFFEVAYSMSPGSIKVLAGVMKVRIARPNKEAFKVGWECNLNCVKKI